MSSPSIPPSRSSSQISELHSRLAALSQAQRNAWLALLRTWDSVDLEDLAIFLRFKFHELTELELATLLGVSRSTIVRMDRYRSSKPKRSDCNYYRRTATKRRRSRSGDYRPLDHPDG